MLTKLATQTFAVHRMRTRPQLRDRNCAVGSSAQKPHFEDRAEN